MPLQAFYYKDAPPTTEATYYELPNGYYVPVHEIASRPSKGINAPDCLWLGLAADDKSFVLLRCPHESKNVSSELSSLVKAVRADCENHPNIIKFENSEETRKILLTAADSSLARLTLTVVGGTDYVLPSAPAKSTWFGYFQKRLRGLGHHPSAL